MTTIRWQHSPRCCSTGEDSGGGWARASHLGCEGGTSQGCQCFFFVVASCQTLVLQTSFIEVPNRTSQVSAGMTPPDTKGHLTSGHFGCPTGHPEDTTGHHRTPQDTTGCSRTPRDAAAHHRTPQDTTGHHRMQQDSAGFIRTPQDNTAPPNTAQHITPQHSTTQHTSRNGGAHDTKHTRVARCLRRCLANKHTKTLPTVIAPTGGSRPNMK